MENNWNDHLRKILILGSRYETLISKTFVVLYSYCLFTVSQSTYFFGIDFGLKKPYQNQYSSLIEQLLTVVVMKLNTRPNIYDRYEQYRIHTGLMVYRAGILNFLHVLTTVWSVCTQPTSYSMSTFIVNILILYCPVSLTVYTLWCPPLLWPVALPRGFRSGIHGSVHSVLKTTRTHPLTCDIRYRDYQNIVPCCIIYIHL